MIYKGNATGGEALAKCSGDRPWHGGKILVVEDNYLQAEVISDCLRDCGLEPVGPAGRLAEACQLAQERPLDGALLDVKLRENLCFPVCTILSARKIPFILLTGYRQPSLISPELRAAPLLCKPFRDDELETALGLILNRRVGDHNRAERSTTHTGILGATRAEPIDRSNAYAANYRGSGARIDPASDLKKSINQRGVFSHDRLS